MSIIHPTVLADALDYLNRGWSVVPLGMNKKPTVPWKPFQSRRPHEDELRQMIQRPGVQGIAIVTGAASGDLAIRDFDSHANYRAWCERHPRLSGTLPTAATKRGRHVYCRSDLHVTKKIDGGEFRGGSSITAAPHSLHRSGLRYEWLIPLPQGELPFVTHEIFTGLRRDSSDRFVAEIAECHGSAVSAISATPTPDEIIQRTLPKVPGERNARILDLVRGLKLNCGITDIDAIREHVRHWHRRALPIITTKEWDATWMDALHAFDRVRHALGRNVVDVAATRVDADELPPAAMQYDGDATRRLIGLCCALASMNGGRFFLSSHDAAARIGIEPVQAWRMLKMLCRDAVLELLEHGNEHRANRYRWLGGKAEQ